MSTKVDTMLTLSDKKCTAAFLISCSHPLRFNRFQVAYQIKLCQYLLSELFLWGRRGEGSSPPPGVGGKEGGPGRPGGRGGAPPLGVGREGEEEATDGEGLELTEGGGGGMSRGMDGRCPPGAGGGGGRSSGSGGLPPGAGGKGGLLLFEGGGGEEKLARGPGVEPPGGGGRGPCLPDGMLGGPDGDPWPGLGPVGSDGGGGPPRDEKD